MGDSISFFLNTTALICTFIDKAAPWRLIVVGDRVIISERDIPEADDFRTCASAGNADFVASPVAMAELATRAVKVLWA
jgi:glutathione synthase/RimK-type ligase-like ATP-grasp enzyme